MEQAGDGFGRKIATGNMSRRRRRRRMKKKKPWNVSA